MDPESTAQQMGFCTLYRYIYVHPQNNHGLARPARRRAAYAAACGTQMRGRENDCCNAAYEAPIPVGPVVVAGRFAYGAALRLLA